jgi:hypothetical protein
VTLINISCATGFFLIGRPGRGVVGRLPQLSCVFSGQSSTWVQHHHVPRATESELCMQLSGIKHLQDSVEPFVSCTVCCVLEGILLRRRPRALHHVHTKQRSGHQGPQEVNLQEYAHTPNVYIWDLLCLLQVSIQEHLTGLPFRTRDYTTSPSYVRGDISL